MRGNVRRTELRYVWTELRRVVGARCGVGGGGAAHERCDVLQAVELSRKDLDDLRWKGRRATLRCGTYV